MAKYELVCEQCYCNDDNQKYKIVKFEKIRIISKVPYETLCVYCLEKLEKKERQ